MYCSGHFVVRCIEMINNKKLKSLDSFVGDGRDVEIILHDGRRNLFVKLKVYWVLFCIFIGRARVASRR